MKTIILSIALLITAIACNKTNKCGGDKKTNCTCTMQYDPVCGCDKKTYGNPCLAECEGITDYTPGECQ